jgi:hypothetical protein
MLSLSFSSNKLQRFIIKSYPKAFHLQLLWSKGATFVTPQIVSLLWWWSRIVCRESVMVAAICPKETTRAGVRSGGVHWCVSKVTATRCKKPMM